MQEVLGNVVNKRIHRIANIDYIMQIKEATVRSRGFWVM